MALPQPASWQTRAFKLTGSTSTLSVAVCDCGWVGWNDRGKVSRWLARVKIELRLRDRRLGLAASWRISSFLDAASSLVLVLKGTWNDTLSAASRAT